MAMRLLSPPVSIPSYAKSFTSHSHHGLWLISGSSSFIQRWSRSHASSGRRGGRGRMTAMCVKVEEETKSVSETGIKWGKVSAVLFDMDGVLCNSEEPSRRAAVEVFAELGVEVSVDDFVPFMGTGEGNFLGGVASVKGVKGFDTDAAKKRFFKIYIEKYAKPNSGIGFPGALELITACKASGLKVAVASSADRIKVDANLAAAGLPITLFDAVVSADAFENLKPAPDIFLAAAKTLNLPPSECIVIEDALAGLQAAKAAEMRSIAVTTTLSEEALATAGPSLIRKDIGNISLDDIIAGGSGRSNETIQGPQHVNTSVQASSVAIEKKRQSAFSFGGLQASRRDALRYASLGISISCLFFTIRNWKAMQYASPKAVWNLIFGVSNPSLEQKEGELRYTRIQQLVDYISDLETRGSALRLPEFPSQLDWLNTTPLQLRRVIWSLSSLFM